MLPSHGMLYCFGLFRLDPDRKALYHEDDLIPDVTKKSLQVLAVLLSDANTLVTHDEIIERVWKDNPHGITSNNIAQCIAELRRTLAKYGGSGEKYIETVRGRGYIFHADVEMAELCPPPANLRTAQEGSFSTSDASMAKPGVRARQMVLMTRFVAVAMGVITVALVVAWLWGWGDDREDVMMVIRESQLFEFLVLYKNPSAFKETDLDRFWTAEFDTNSNYDRRRIRDAVAKMVTDGRRYGDESKCEQFDFQSVEINSNGDMAVVKTLEKWFVAVYFNDGTLQKNRTIGPYFVSYVLRKINGRWLIEKSNTARANVSPPKVRSIEPVTSIKAGQQFFINVTGEDFLPEIVQIKVVGPGCPESQPCTVPNGALREHSKISETEIRNVPLTLTTGEFTLYFHNGDSQASNPTKLVVSE